MNNSSNLRRLNARTVYPARSPLRGALRVVRCGVRCARRTRGTLTMHQAVDARLAEQPRREARANAIQRGARRSGRGPRRVSAESLHRFGRGLHPRFSVAARRPGARPFFSSTTPQALFNPLLKGQQHAAEDRAKNQKIEIDRVRDDVIVRTAIAYLELGKVRHSLDLMRSEQASGEKILEVDRDRVAANQELPIEVTRERSWRWRASRNAS